MSADLFAEFGAGSGSKQPSKSVRQQNVGSQLIPGLETSEHVFPNFSNPSEQSIPQSSQPRFSSNSSQSFHVPAKDPFNGFSQQNDSNVLFDATLEKAPDDDETDDDWGEFESAETLPKDQPKESISMIDSVGGSAHSKRPGNVSVNLNLMDSLSIEDKTPPVKGQSIHSKPAKPLQNQGKIRPFAPAKAPDLFEEEPFDEWGDFVDGPPTQPKPNPKVPKPTHSKKPSQSINISSEAKRTPSGFPSSSEQHVSPSQVRPTNIPPPSVLLELFPRLLEQLRKESITVKSPSQGKEALEEVALRVICTLKSAARVIAGRTLRWKRDTILSQSMKIGPARAGRSGGMKLNTVNKNEDVKEQQEAVDVLNLWRDRTAIFNSVIQASGRRPIAVIADNARVITAMVSQGAIKASHACALCGLKRDERLGKVDENVEDSFGEWWTDHWGHTECKQFWEGNMGLLDQR